jgi:hypothetical protein
MAARLDRRTRRMRLSALVASLLGAVLFAATFGVEGETAQGSADAAVTQARRRGRAYGGGGRSYVRQCIRGTGYGSGCTERVRTCRFCTKEDMREAVRQCGRNRQCRRAAKAGARNAIRECRTSQRECKACCRSAYATSCGDVFAGTSGYPAFFRTKRVCTYGGYRRDARGYRTRVRRCRHITYKPDCTGATTSTTTTTLPPGSPSGAFRFDDGRA